MNKFSIYSKRAALIIRIYCICILVLLVPIDIKILIHKSLQGQNILTFFSNLAVIIITSILFFMPSKIELISICTGYYGIVCMMMPDNTMGLFM